MDFADRKGAELARWWESENVGEAATQIAAAIREAVLAEREACAVALERFGAREGWTGDFGQQAIREREG